MKMSVCCIQSLMCLNLKLTLPFRETPVDVFVLPAVVMWGTNWCWHADIDKEVHLTMSFILGGFNTLHVQFCYF